MLGGLKNLWQSLQGTKPTVPEGQRVYAIGDIHGRLDLLDALHGLIAEDAVTAPELSKTVVYLGDYIDRGLHSRGVIERLIAAPLKDVEPVYLMGNHEATLLDFLDDHRAGASWFQFGGDATLYSYSVPLSGPFSDQKTLIDAQLTLRENLPEAHLAFLRGLETQFRIGDYFFVHAGIRPGVPIEKQAVRDLIWIREEFLDSTANHGVMVVHGHSISLEVEELPNRINIDTGAYASNVLTCLAMEGEDHWLLQTKA